MELENGIHKSRPKGQLFEFQPGALLSSALTLAAWRWRQQWFLLLVTGLGMMLAIALVGSLPLFSSVMTTAGMRNTLRAQSDNAPVMASVSLPGLSSQLVSQTTALISQQMQQDLGSALQSTPQVSVKTVNWLIQGNPAYYSMGLYGVSIPTAQAHFQLLQGRLPASSGSRIEILLSPTAALYLGVKVGSSLTLTNPFYTTPFYRAQSYSAQATPPPTATITVHVVGIFQSSNDDAYWAGEGFDAPKPAHQFPQPPFEALTASAPLLQFFDNLAQQQKADGVFSTSQATNILNLAYNLNTTRLSSADLNDVIARLGNLQKDTTANFPSGGGNGSSPYLTNVTLSGVILHSAVTPSLLEKFRDQVAIGQTPALVLTAQIVALILFFISTMCGVLVERQQVAIAVMHSRGASRQQVLGSLITQGVGLCLLAGLVGPLLALGMIYLVAPLLLPAGSRDALNALTLHPWQAISALGEYTLLIAVGTLLTLLLTLTVAARGTVLSQRREETRSTRRPLWQRLRLDLVIAMLALVGYVLAFYVESIAPALSTQAQSLVATPVELLAPLLLLIAGILFFVRFFPHALRLLALLTQRRRGLSSMLACAQMARAPRQPMRMALLLGLATAFALFSLVFSASQQQRASDLATYQTGSDFSGYLSSSDLAGPLTYVPGLPAIDLGRTGSPALVAQTTARYRQIAGVTSASVGYEDTLYLLTNTSSTAGYARSTQLYAVDPATFTQTALWTPQDSTQPLSVLMAQLAAQRASAIKQNEVPAILATSTWQLLGLSPGDTFHLTDDLGNPDTITYVALAEVAHIPPIDDSTQGAMLVDYQTLATARALHQEPMLPNYLWLCSSSSPAAVAHIRTVLGNSAYHLLFLADRRALVTANAADPLSLNVISLLSIGVAVALLLAFLANLLLPLFSVRMRATSFAVLRALGTDPRQVVGILTWEQGIILGTSLLLGLFFGALLAVAAVPPLILTSVLPTGENTISASAIFTLQRIIPTRIIFPLSLVLALAILIGLCLLALGLMARLAQSSLLGQALRLNED